MKEICTESLLSYQKISGMRLPLMFSKKERISK